MTSIRPIDTIKFTSTANEPKKIHKHYLEATEVVTTDNLVKPLPGKGHLVKDNPITATKYFFVDIGYDIKSLVNGINGTANDHQSGRLNDVGLRLGGIGIAAYLASRTPNLKYRVMEYVGLGTFLTAMSIFPKLAIYAPAQAVHGFNIGKEYIDDQGRKKSVFQDSNYIPYDLYNDEKYGEDLDKIGDKLGIPRDIKNRNNVIKEQMRKVATQNNTLWMLSAGFATPTLTALACCGFEQLIGNYLGKVTNEEVNKKIHNLSKAAEAMSETRANLQNNKLGQEVEAILSKYKNSGIPDAEIEKVITLLTKGLDSEVSQGVAKDIRELVKNSGKVETEKIILDKPAINALFKSMNDLNREFVPSRNELAQIAEENFKNGLEVERKSEFFNKVSEKIRQRAAANTNLDKDFVAELVSDIESAFQIKLDKLKREKVIKEDKQLTEKIVDFAKIIGEFKDKNEEITKCITSKVEQVEDTVIARYYAKFEKAFLKELGISYKELEKMRDSENYTKEILDKKLREISSDSAKFEKVMKNLGSIITETETALHGADMEKSVMQELVVAMENTFNKTAKRINSLGFGDETIKKLVGEPVEDLKLLFNSKDRIIDLMDGTLPNLRHDLDLGEYKNFDYAKRVEYLKHNHMMTGSYKKLKLDNLVEKYQGARNSFFRIMHTLDLYHRTVNPENLQNAAEYAESLVNHAYDTNYAKYLSELSKKIMMSFTPEDATLKFDISDENTFKDIANLIWGEDKKFAQKIKDANGDFARLDAETQEYCRKLAEFHGLSYDMNKFIRENFDERYFYQTHQYGNVSDAAKKALDGANKPVLERFQKYITTFRNIVLNNPKDFQKPKHILNGYIGQCYANNARTDIARFNLVAQEPSKFAKAAANRRYNNLKWRRVIGGIAGVTVTATLLAQFTFGKISNKHNLKTIEKQVNDDANQ